MSLLPDQWSLLEELAAAHARAPGWLHGGHDEGDGRRRTSAVQALARESLCELASAGPEDLPGPRGEGTGWAARITADGVLALQYRCRRDQPVPAPRPAEVADPALVPLELLDSEMEPLRRFLAIPGLGDARLVLVRDVVEQAWAVPGGRRWQVTATPEQVEAIGFVLRLEALAGTARAWHRFLREYGPPIRPAR
ncbi:hypothetical protein GCM10018781_60590 [Kitasatospora indigofera]|uniref:Uncharacterized protein n=1 Tax=Kitasatospora indigofera TaxID=67307 RepID=A0A919L0J9_9ACTN|nr:DUF6417 family protein [Kitasatospora indigofera]GHH80410.1 hypothetical protein GCM10018781_60590 [Kitasatospora indigofera]